jgi:hypothetical protein
VLIYCPIKDNGSNPFIRNGGIMLKLKPIERIKLYSQYLIFKKLMTEKNKYGVQKDVTYMVLILFSVSLMLLIYVTGKVNFYGGLFAYGFGIILFTFGYFYGKYVIMFNKV